MKSIHLQNAELINITLPWPPSINHYYGRAKSGQVFIDAEGKRYRKSVGSYCMMWKVKKLTGRLQAVITCSPPDKRKRDLDNVLKCLLDALQAAGCFDDDNQIDDLRIVRVAPADKGCVQVKLREISAPE